MLKPSRSLTPEPIEHEQILRNLAQDIVKNIQEVPDILKKFHISHEEYLRLAEMSPFKNMLQEAAVEWDGAKNTPERIKLKSALLVEEALPGMFGVLNNQNEPLAGRVELLKTLGKLGGLGHAPPPDASQLGNTFKLEINFPTEPKRNIVIEHTALPSEVTPPDNEFGDVNDELISE